MAKRLCFIRHGHCINIDGSNYVLSEKGRRAMRRAGKELLSSHFRPVQVFVSEQMRSIQSATELLKVFECSPPLICIDSLMARDVDPKSLCELAEDGDVLYVGHSPALATMKNFAQGTDEHVAVNEAEYFFITS